MTIINKICAACKIEQPLTSFILKNYKPYSYCNKCNAARVLLYSRTPIGLSNTIYTRQVTSSKRRNHLPPAYTRNWLYEWLVFQPNFSKLFNDWTSSNYAKDLCPSVDRLNDNEGYSSSNIQLMSWKENNDKGSICYRSNINPKIGRAVLKIDPITLIVLQQYPNIILPALEHGCSAGEISRVCMGRRKTCHGFIWRYVDAEIY